MDKNAKSQEAIKDTKSIETIDKTTFAADIPVKDAMNVKTVHIAKKIINIDGSEDAVINDEQINALQPTQEIQIVTDNISTPSISGLQHFAIMEAGLANGAIGAASDAGAMGAASGGAAMTGGAMGAGAAGAGAMAGGIGAGTMLAGGAVVVGGAAMAASHSGGSSGSPSAVTPTTKLSVMDGIISGAKVYAVDSQGVKTLLGTTDLNGALTVNSSDLAGKTLMSVGGTDMSTGLAVSESYMAAVGSTVVNPITTLVQSMVANNNMTEANAENAVKTALGISQSTSLASFNYMSQTDAASTAMYKVAAQVSSIMGAAAGANTTSVDYSAIAAKNIADMIAKAPSQTLDLTNSTNIQNILSTNMSGTTMATNASTIAASLASLNLAISNSSMISNMVQNQKLAQSTIADAVKNNATDLLSNINSSSMMSQMLANSNDTTAPTISTLSDFNLNASALASFSTTVTVADNTGGSGILATKAKLVAPGGYFTTLSVADNNGTETISGDLHTLADGAYALLVSTMDKAGNLAVTTSMLHIDTLSISSNSTVTLGTTSGNKLAVVDDSNPTSGVALSSNTFNATSNHIYEITQTDSNSVAHTTALAVFDESVDLDLTSVAKMQTVVALHDSVIPSTAHALTGFNSNDILDLSSFLSANGISGIAKATIQTSDPTATSGVKAIDYSASSGHVYYDDGSSLHLLMTLDPTSSTHPALQTSNFKVV